MAKHERCPECGLKIRCGDIERHQAGYSHKRRKETLAAAAKEAEKRAYNAN